MIDVVIISYNEPKATLRAVNTFFKQTKSKKIRVTVVDPFPEVEKFLRKNIKDKRFNFILDPGEGKNSAITLVFQEYNSDNKNDLFILTDGDVFVSDNAIEKISKAFKNPKLGCVAGRPVSTDPKNTKYGYWSHFLFSAANKMRKNLSKQNKVFETTGYLQAIRKGVIFECPEGTADDNIIPYLFWKKGYLIKYLPEVEVYVKNPNNWIDWKNQKIRNIKSHEKISRVAPDMPRMKTFYSEAKGGISLFFAYPKKIKEFLWTIQLYLARFFIYGKAFRDIKNKKSYRDDWRETEIASTRPLD